MFWHTTKKRKSLNYHLNKTEYYKKFNIRIIHIFEDEWLEHTELIKTKLMNIFKKSKTKLYARQCFINPISTKLKNEFFNTYSFNIKDKSKIKLGLFHKHTKSLIRRNDISIFK